MERLVFSFRGDNEKTQYPKITHEKNGSGCGNNKDVTKSIESKQHSSLSQLDKSNKCVAWRCLEKSHLVADSIDNQSNDGAHLPKPNAEFPLLVATETRN
jgi:hypothetical protein